MSYILFLLLNVLVSPYALKLNNLSWNSKIVNGTDVKEGEIPYQVSLQTSFGHFCGGSILNENYVITAAHCVNRKVAKQILVIVGTINLQQPYMTYRASKIISHDYYSPFKSYIHDIALVKVENPFKFSKRVQPVALPEFKWKVPVNATAVVSGWGALGGSSSQLSNTLQKAQIWIADQDYCREVMRERYLTIHLTHICANDPNNRKGQCSGDSGGPLIVDGKLTGIVSWSIKDPFCASTKYPGVYTRIPEYNDWIFENSV